MRAFFLIALFALMGSVSWAQELVIDPTTSGAMLVSSSVINGQLNKTNDNLSAINRAQLAVSGQLVIVNDLQSKIYKGLSQVASVVNNLYSIKEIAETGSDIISDVGKAVSIARGNPVLLLFAEQGARDFQQRATGLAADVGAYVLRGGNDNLMDAGERSKLLNHIAAELRILRGIAYGMQRAMYWAQMKGIWRSLNPWASWESQDVRLANSVISEAKYLRR